MRLFFLLILTMFLGLAGCMGPLSLHKAVLSYDETISQLEREMLLINIARTHCEIPGHYTVTSSIAATFDYQANIKMEGTFFERVTGGVNKYIASLGASMAEKPTLSIIPIQGEEFTKRILSPLDENKFLFLIFQGVSIDMSMRMMARGIEMQNPDGTFKRFILNWPLRPKEYEEFRRIALHLSWLNANRKLFVGKLYFNKSIKSKLPGPLTTNDLTNALEKDYHWQQLGEDGTYELAKPTIGRITITNYDPKALTNSERQALNGLAAANPNNFILVDIRPDHPGGEFPLFGKIKLRSMGEIAKFVASGIDKYPEFDVEPDPRSGIVDPNPGNTLTVLIDAPTKPGALKVSYGGHNYTIGNTSWDRQAFNLLYQLFQMTVTDVSGVGAPTITISK
jgi:hypothetical protein